MPLRIGIIGTGNMGGAIIKGLSKAQKAYEIYAYDINAALTDSLSKKYDIKVSSTVKELVQKSDVVITAVKPQYMKDVLKECAKCIDSSTLFVSVAVGLPISFYEKILGEDMKLIRTMPNTPALIGEGITIVSYGKNVSYDEKHLVKEIFSCIGIVEELDECLMSAVTALTSSSPAYVYMMIEAMADGGVQSGIPRNICYRLAAQAVLGSARMVLETGTHPAELKDMVCSPAGTTIEAVAVLEEKRFRNAIITAMSECTRRANEIGGEQNK